MQRGPVQNGPRAVHVVAGQASDAGSGLVWLRSDRSIKWHFGIDEVVPVSVHEQSWAGGLGHRLDEFGVRGPR